MIIPGARLQMITKDGANMKAKATCGKRRFRDEYEAGKRLKFSIARAERNGYKSPQRYYYHAECNGFHLTSQPDREETPVRYWYIEQIGQEQAA